MDVLPYVPKRPNKWNQIMSSAANEAGKFSEKMKLNEAENIKKGKIAAFGKKYGIDDFEYLPESIQKEIVGGKLRGDIETQKQAASFSEQLEKQNEAKRKVEKEDKESEDVIKAIEDYRGEEPGSLKGFKKNPSIASTITKPEKEPKKTQASQPIDADQLKRIQSVKSSQEYQKGDAVKKHELLFSGGVSKENTDSIMETEKEKVKLASASKDEAEKLKAEHHKYSEKFDTELRASVDESKRQLEGIKTIRSSINKEGFSPNSATNFFKMLSNSGSKTISSAAKSLSNAFLTSDQASIAAATLSLYHGFKDLFGGRITDADLQIIESKLPDMGKSREANEAIIRIFEKYAKQEVLRGKIARDIKKENKEHRPIGYEDLISDRFNEMTRPVKMITDKGKEVDVPAYQINDAIKANFRVK